MQIDRFGTRLATCDRTAAAHVEDATYRILAHRPDVDATLALALTADGHCAGAHALRGLCQVTLARSETLVAARGHLAAAEAARRAAGATGCETALIAALQAAVTGGLRAAAECCEAELGTHPDALLLAKLAQALRFMSGDIACLARGVDRHLGATASDAAGYGFALGCKSFALEEQGALQQAESLGRRAFDLDPADAWAAHAVAHVFEMGGRPRDGLAWLGECRASWSACNNFAQHLSWHEALFHLETGDADAALALYDTAIWARPSDDFRDLSNAVSFLSRLDVLGYPVAQRWESVAETAARQHDDVTYCFASLHRLIALLAAGRMAEAGDLVAALERPSSPHNDQERVQRTFARPLARLLLDTAQGSSRRIDMAALLPAIVSVGGSHAQRDLFLLRLLAIARDLEDPAAVTAALDMRGRLKASDRFDRLFRTRRHEIAPVRRIA